MAEPRKRAAKKAGRPTKAAPRRAQAAALPDVVYAQASPRSLGGVSLFDTTRPVDAGSVPAFASDEGLTRTAASRLQAAGFEVLQISPVTINIAGAPSLYEEVFNTRLVTEERPVIKPGARADTATFIDSPDTDLRGLVATDGTPLGDVLEGVAIEEPVYFMQNAFAPTKAYWHLGVPGDVSAGCSADPAHRAGITGRGIKVVMVDSGWFRHPYFTRRGYRASPVVLGPAAANPNDDESGHGTGESANLFAVAPDIDFTMVKINFVNSTGAFNAAVALQPQIISNSWGSSIQTGPLSAANQALAAAIAVAVAQGIIVVFSAGNGHFGFPGQHPDVISAGGVFMDDTGNLQASSYASGFASGVYPGRNVPDLSGLVGMSPGASYIMLPVQPSDQIDTSRAGGTWPPQDETASNDGWAAFSGTSAAAPMLAGAAALVRHACARLTPAEVRRILIATATDVTTGTNALGQTATTGYDLATGAGLVDAYRAVVRARLTCRPIITPPIRPPVVITPPIQPPVVITPPIQPPVRPPVVITPPIQPPVVGPVVLPPPAEPEAARPSQPADRSGTDLGWPAPPRVLNVALSDIEQRTLAEVEALEPDRDYFVRIDIGSQAEASVVVNPIPIPVEDLEPSSSQGWWFDVVVTSSDVFVISEMRRLFLPFFGPSWVCACSGPDHECLEPERLPHLYIPFRTGTSTGEKILRCTLYDRNNAVQSVRVEFVVGHRRGASAVLRGVIDYSLAEDVSHGELLGPRQLNVLTNESPGGTHTVVVKGDDLAIAVDLTETATAKILRELRAQLTRITLGPDGKRPQYDNDNAKPTKGYVADLEALAHLGAAFWQKVMPRGDDRDCLLELLSTRATIQISRVTNVVFPWALVYDIPHTLGDPFTPCPLLADRENQRATLVSYPGACPYHAPRDLNVLCPYGFWGFRHLIEQPASVSRGLLRTAIPVSHGASAAVVHSHDLDQQLTAEHLKGLRGCLEGRFRVTDCDSKNDLLDAMKDPTLPILYFYCHGRTTVLVDTELELPCLEIGRNEILGPGDFGAWADAGAWNRHNWVNVPPLIFINGCHTAALSPDDVASFVDAFAGMEAAGVVGTEIPVAQPVASEVALRFYAYFAGPERRTVGEALHRTRIDLLAKGNVSGLVYTPFCSMDLTLLQAA